MITMARSSSRYNGSGRHNRGQLTANRPCPPPQVRATRGERGTHVRTYQYSTFGVVVEHRSGKGYYATVTRNGIPTTPQGPYNTAWAALEGALKAQAGK